MTNPNTLNQPSLVNLDEGARFIGNLLLNDVIALKTKAGASYLKVELSDSTGKIGGIQWDMSLAEIHSLKPFIGSVIKVDATVTSFNGQMQLSLNQLTPIDASDPANNPELFIKHAPIETKQLQIDIEAYLALIQQAHPDYAAIISDVLARHAVNFYQQPAAKMVHHSFYGGLAYHTLRMLKHAYRLYGSQDNSQPLYADVDVTLLYAGIILHDIGKTLELTGPVGTTYTIQGDLLGHISIADGWLIEACVRHDISPDTEKIVLLRHLILAHHGTHEWGSPVLPATPEAQALHFIDTMDADSMIYETSFAEQAPGTLGDSAFGLSNIRPYKRSTLQ